MASKIRQLVDLQRRILRNTAAKRMLRSCSVTPKEFGNNQWLVYDRDVKLVYDSSTDLYAKCETEGRLRTFRTLNDLVAKLDSEIDSSKYPNVLGERKSLLALGHPGRSPRKVVMVSK